VWELTVWELPVWELVVDNGRSFVDSRPLCHRLDNAPLIPGALILKEARR
jgi:hypothetical protein